MLSIRLLLDLQTGSLATDFTTKILYAYVMSQAH